MRGTAEHDTKPVTKSTTAILVLCWLGVQAGLWIQYGIRTDFEAVKYIHEAHTFLKTGSFSSPNFWFYSLEIFLIAFCIQLKLGFGTVVFIHLLVNALACSLFYRFTISVADKKTAFITTALLLICIPFHQYNVALQTESLFHSLIVLYTVYLLKQRRITFKTLAIIVGFLLLLMLTRPSGLLLIPPTLVYLISKLNRGSNRFVLSAAVIALFITGWLILDRAMGSGGELDFMLPFKENMIICGVPVHHTAPNLSDNPNSLGGILYYITHNFSQFAPLALNRTIAFFGVYRSYFSPVHNGLLMGFFFLLYPLAAMGIYSWFKMNRGLLRFCIVAVISVWCSVILTCDDWHNRFVVTIVPHLLILAIPFISKVVSRFVKKEQRNLSKTEYADDTPH
ncbi:hypothetical protein [Niabella aurantiaca]|uniref:hypothetical protein n=1 Tax=Niabella aurantiaca TaxID=379900 RepID=UPI00036C7760|nr:hypothetical protein [Niabella aurantiaca]